MTAPLDIHSLAGAYALDALDELERELFEDHVIACESCAWEVAELRETASRLADDTWSTPPPRMRAAVMDRIRNTRQAFPPMRPVTRRPPALRWRHRTRTLVAAAVAAVVASAGVYAVQEMRLRQQRIEAQAEAARIQTVLAAPDTVLRTGSIEGGGHLSIVMSPSMDEAVITLTDAKELDPDKTYQLWLIAGSSPRSAGVLDAGQIQAMRLVSGVRGVDTLAVTIENEGGSTSPSQQRVATVSMT